MNLEAIGKEVIAELTEEMAKIEMENDLIRPKNLKDGKEPITKFSHDDNFAKLDQATLKLYKNVIKVQHEISEDLTESKEFLLAMDERFKDLVRIIHTKCASQAIVRHQIDVINRLHKGGFLLDKESDEFNKQCINQ